LPDDVVDVICRTLTSKSRRLSDPISKTTSFGVNLDASYPPNIRLPNTLFSRYTAPAVYDQLLLAILPLENKVSEKLACGFP
jgi:hypothetical protein